MQDKKRIMFHLGFRQHGLDASRKVELEEPSQTTADTKQYLFPLSQFTNFQSLVYGILPLESIQTT